MKPKKKQKEKNSLFSTFAVQVKGAKKRPRQSQSSKNSGVQNSKAKTLFSNNTTKQQKVSLISEITHLSEKIRPHKVKDEQKEQLVNLVLSKLQGQVSELVTNPKVSRALQLCLQYGTSAERNSILKEIRRKLPELSKLKYGKHLVQRLIARSSKEEFDQEIFPLFRQKSLELLKHQFGSDVMNDVYFRSSETQKEKLLLHCYGLEFLLTADSASASQDQSSLEVLCREMDPVRRAGVLRKVHELETVLIEKGLLVNQLVHRLTWEFLKTAPAAHVVEIASLIAETGDGLLKMVHTSDGASVAAAVLFYGTAQGRKRALRGFRDYVKQTAMDEWGHVVFLMAFRVVDDTQLLKKLFLKDFLQHLGELVRHRYSRCIVLDLLHRRCSWYVPSKTESILAPRQLSVDCVGESKKEDLTRRMEILGSGQGSLRDALVQLCIAETESLLHCRRGCDVLVEVARGGDTSKLFEEDKIQQIQDCIVALCKIPSTLTERVSKGAVIQLISFSKSDDNSFAKKFCRKVWDEVLCDSCQDWVESPGRDVLIALMSCGEQEVAAAVKREISAALSADETLEDWMKMAKQEKTQKRKQLFNWRMQRKRKTET